MSFNHISVLSVRSVELLNVQPFGIYLDGTCGGGGHSQRILENGGKVIGLDIDEDAIEHLKQKFQAQPDFTIIKGNFKNAKELLANAGIESLDGAILDLGVSSHQLDTPERGFSYHNDGPLDMRMNTQADLTAKDVVNTYSEQELARIIYEYADERYSRRIAKAIVTYRRQKLISTTTELASIIQASVPHRKGAHPAKKTFQAIRIEVNGELDGLREALADIFQMLKSGARLCVITFHSLEDKIAKQYFKDLSAGCICDKSLPVCICGNLPKARLIAKIKADEKELDTNYRSHSATGRIIEKL